MWVPVHTLITLGPLAVGTHYFTELLLNHQVSKDPLIKSILPLVLMLQLHQVPFQLKRIKFTNEGSLFFFFWCVEIEGSFLTFLLSILPEGSIANDPTSLGSSSSINVHKVFSCHMSFPFTFHSTKQLLTPKDLQMTELKLLPCNNINNFTNKLSFNMHKLSFNSELKPPYTFVPHVVLF